MTARATIATAASVAAIAALCATPAVAAAQVGYPPAASPFRDLVYHQEVSVSGGWFVARKDPAGVAPKSGPMIAARYAAQFGNPVIVAGRIATAFSERDVIDPTKPVETRVVETRATQLLMADVTVGVGLTGFRSWHRLVPELNGGVGLVSDLRGRDPGGYQFGTPFAFSAGGAVRWEIAERWNLRADVTDRLYRIAYPQSYFQTTGSVPAVLGAQDGTSLWTHNPSLTIGLSYHFDR